MGRDALKEALEEAFSEALLVGAENWDNYMEPNRWPELKETHAYQRLMQMIENSS